jgi:hypothetical protein
MDGYATKGTVVVTFGILVVRVLGQRSLNCIYPGPSALGQLAVSETVHCLSGQNTFMRESLEWS